MLTLQMFTTARVAIILAAMLSPMAAASEKADAGPPFFGLNGVGFFHYRDAPDAAAQARRKLDAFTHAGAKIDRFDFWWGEIEPTRGTFKWDKADWLIDFYQRAGVGMLPILCYRANWMKDDPPHTDQDFADFANYTRRVVSRYKGRVKYWEIWNEPNIPTFWKPPNVADYAKLLQAAY